MHNAFSENQLIIVWAVITTLLIKLIIFLGDLYGYQGFISAEDSLNCIASTFEWFLSPYSLAFPPFLILTIPILIVFGLLIRYVFSQKKGFSAQAKFVVLILVLWAWGMLNDFALDILASA